MNVQPSLVSDDQSLELVQPCPRALDRPPVLAQILAALHSFANNPRSDTSLPRSTPAPLKAVPFVSMQLGRSFPSPSAKHPSLLDRLDSINDIGESGAIMHVGQSADYRERNSSGFDHNMAATWRFVPGLPLSVGLGPARLAHSPLFGRYACKVHTSTPLE